jgi:hypothetical protein
MAAKGAKWQWQCPLSPQQNAVLSPELLSRSSQKEKGEKKKSSAMPPHRRRHGRDGGAWLVLAGLCAGIASANVMRGFGSGSSSPSDADILVKLQALYSEKLKPLEKKSRQAAAFPQPIWIPARNSHGSLAGASMVRALVMSGRSLLLFPYTCEAVR